MLKARGSMTVVRNGREEKVRSYVVMGGLTAESRLGVYNASVDNAERALKERYFLVKTDEGFCPPLTPTKGWYKRKGFRKFKESVTRIRPSVYNYHETAEFYTGPKRVTYLKAADTLMRHNLRRREAGLKMFIKFEKQNLDKAPRCINPRGPRYTLSLARYLKKLEKRVYSRIDKLFAKKLKGCKTVLKGMNAQQVARNVVRKWNRFKDPVAVGMDAMKFDMHVHEDALQYEHSIYNEIFKDRELAKLLRWQLSNRGRAWFVDGEIRFFIKGTRSSGDINTSCGNVIIMCALVYDTMMALGVDYELCNNGDDSVLIVERADLQRVLLSVPRYCERAGFRMTMEDPVYVLEGIEFCQTHPCLVSGKWTMVRNLSACLQKDGMCLQPITNSKSLSKWLYAVGTCNSILHAGVPVLEAMARCFLRYGTKCSDAMLQKVFYNTSMFARIQDLGTTAGVRDETRASFYEAFNVLPDLQIELEEYFDKLELDLEIKPRMHVSYKLQEGNGILDHLLR